MSNKNNNAAAEAVVALQQDYNTKLEVLNGLIETATDEERLKAKTDVDEAKSLLDAELVKANKSSDNAGKGNSNTTKAKLVKGKFLLSPTGRYNLAYNVGEEASLPELQANELDESGYFKIGK